MTNKTNGKRLTRIALADSLNRIMKLDNDTEKSAVYIVLNYLTKTKTFKLSN